MSAGETPSAEPPSSGSSRFPDPFAPDSPPPQAHQPRPPAQHSGSPAQQSGPQVADPAVGSASGTEPLSEPAPAPSAGASAATPHPATPSADGPSAGPGAQDLPWKATAERRDLWGPKQTALEGTVRGPASREVSAARPSWLVRLGAPVVLGGLAGLAALLVVLGTGLGGPVLALGAAVGVGAVALGGVGVAVNRPRSGSAERPVIDASVAGGTREVLERILEADAATRDRVAQLRPQASAAPATQVLDDVDALLTRIDALVGAEQLQQMRPSAGEVTMLEGIATRYVPDLVDAAADIISFLRTFAGSAREEALANLASIDRQLDVLAEGVERIESDLVGGVSRSLEVHSEFLRQRFADQHLDPIIDV
ncbi:hypothetical protein ACTXMW_12050 [Brachybacterium paraconglomeratum]|uniref:hypothetical protein n=1 Tax=Brachybacterium paraconglomeratum TaxID=173362 RepID=UPI003FD12266